ncbi:MAG: DUF3108 domain-containing protein [Ramlibacter sp.]
MARGARLSAVGPGTRLAALSAMVLLVHVFALRWLAEQLEQQPILRPMATPMFTRVLRPAAMAAVAPRKKPAARAARSHAAITAIAKPAPATPPATSASAPKAPAEPASSALAQASAPAAPAAADPPPVPASAASAAAPPNYDSWPADTRLNYRLGGVFRSGELHGNARVQWLRQGDRYESRIDIDVTLLVSLVLTSQGDVTPQGLSPRAYEELRRGGARNVRLEADAVVLNDGRRVPRPERAQDSASQFVELSHRFATGEDKLAVGGSVSLWMARPGGVDQWTYDIVDRETLQLPQLGAVEAFHLKPRQLLNPRGNITAEIWFAPSLQYLPVRIKVSLGEATYVDLLVDTIQQR